MQQMKCVKCGTEIQVGGRFCPKCGSPVEAAQTVSGGEVPQQASEVTESNKKGKKITAASVILSIFLSLLLVVLGTGTSVLFIVRQGLGETSIENAIKKVDLTEVHISVLYGSRDDETLPELIYDHISSNFRSYMPDRREAIKDIENFLEKDFIQEFVAAKTSDYVTDMLKDTGDGKIEVDEIMELLEDHKKDLNKLVQSDYKLTDRDFEDIENHLIRNVDFDNFKLSKLRRENRTMFDTIRWIGSNLVLGILLGACVLLAVVLFLVNRRFRRTMVYLGVCFVLVGILDCVVGAIIGMIAGMLNGRISLLMELFNALFAPTRMWSFIVGGSLIFLGLLAAILPQVLRKKKVVA